MGVLAHEIIVPNPMNGERDIWLTLNMVHEWGHKLFRYSQTFVANHHLVCFEEEIDAMCFVLMFPECKVYKRGDYEF